MNQAAHILSTVCKVRFGRSLSVRARPWHTLNSSVLSASLSSITLNDAQPRGKEDERFSIVADVIRIVTSLEKQGSRVCPVIGATVRLGPKAEDTSLSDPSSPLPKHLLYIPISFLFRSALRVSKSPNEQLPWPVSEVAKRVARSSCASYASGSLAHRV